MNNTECILRAQKLSFSILVIAWYLAFPQNFCPPLWPIQPPILWGYCLLNPGHNVKGVKLTIYYHLVLIL